MSGKAKSANCALAEKQKNAGGPKKGKLTQAIDAFKSYSYLLIIIC